MNWDRAVDRVAVPVVGVTLPFVFTLFLWACASVPTKTVNVERTTTSVVSVPMAVACFKKVDLIPVPKRTTVANIDTATTDQLAAAAAADRENFVRYGEAVAAAMAQCAEGSPK
jgi:hypothetical protein